MWDNLADILQKLAAKKLVKSWSKAGCLDLLQVDLNCTGKKVARRARATSLHSEARARRTAF